MKISEYIDALEAIRREHGDLEVDSNNYYGRDSARAPTTGYRKILKKRQTREEFWSPYGCDPDQKGEKVVRI